MALLPYGSQTKRGTMGTEMVLPDTHEDPAMLRSPEAGVANEGTDSPYENEAEAGEERGEGLASKANILSPFLTGTSIQYAWDSTSLGYLKTCPRKYQYKLLEGWSHEAGIHLRWGGEFHSALEDYERSRAVGIRHDDAVHDTIRALFARLEGWEPEPRSKSEELKTKGKLIEAVIWYLENYNPDPAEVVILANGKPAVEVSFQFEIDLGPKPNRLYDDGLWDQPYLLCGHLDKIVTFAGEPYVMDHKTTTTTPGSYYFEQYDPNNQMSLYTLASQVILGTPIKGVIIDVVQIASGFTRFTRGITYRTSDQLEEWLTNTKSWLRLAEHYARDGFWPMNDTACDKFGGCEFRGVCSKSPSVRDRFLAAGFERKEPWNPLRPR